MQGRSKSLCELETLFAGYFNQDWVDDYGSPDAAVADYLKSSGIDVIRNARDSISEFRSLMSASPDPDKALGAFGCEYSPDQDNLSVDEWLERLSATMTAYLIDKGAG